MRRRCLLIEDMDVYTPRNPAPHSGYVPEGSPFGHLLWREIRDIENKSNMTDTQRCVFELYLWGCSIREISDGLGKSYSTVHNHLTKALCRAQKIAHRGLFTVMIEEFGWQEMRLYISEMIDMRMPHHPEARRMIGGRNGDG